MKYLALLVFAVISLNAFSQDATDLKPSNLPGMQPGMNAMPMREHLLQLQKARYASAPTLPGARTTMGTGPVFDTSLWRHRVDSTWGTGRPDSVKLAVLNAWWGHIDSLYPCFVHLPAYNWDSIVTGMRAEITAGGVSEGRYAAMINYLLGLVNDGHTNFYDYAVNYVPSVYPGLPLFRGESGRFGACITPVFDTVALVYNSFPGHPFGLQAGDVILGYNGIPWIGLVKMILNYTLPNSVYKGSTDTATLHRYIQAAGENWYLFDTINIKKCDGSLVNLPTSLMTGALYQTFCTEQVPVAGVHIPTYYEYYTLDKSVTYGVVAGTRVGYVYMYDCTDTGGKLYNAVRTLVEDSMVQGLIIDIRTNFGGGFLAYWRAFEYLASGGSSWVGYGERSDPTNRLAMHLTGPTSWYDIYDTDPNYFDHKLAILCGPNAVSAGDFLPVMFKHNPHVKLFGESTAGAFGNLVPVNLPYTGFSSSMQEVNFFESSNPSYYITHTMFPVDSAMWLNKDSVCNGRDNVAWDAIRWIEDDYLSVENYSSTPSVSIFPNPANNFVNLSVSTRSNDNINIKLCNMLGSAIKDHSYIAEEGNNIIKINIENIPMPSGNYYLSLTFGNGERVIKKLTVIR